MNTLNQLSNLDMRQNLILNDMMKPDNSQAVYDYSGNYNVIDWYITRANKARRIVGDDGQFQKPIMGLGAVATEIKISTKVGNDLKVEFMDSSYDLFRIGFIVSDGSAGNWMGRVRAKGAGFIVLEAAPPIPINGWDTTIHFLTGRTAVELVNASVNRGSDNVESLYSAPQFVKNHTSISRDSVTLSRRDFSQTWVDGASGFWGNKQEQVMMKRYGLSLDYKAIFQEFGKRNMFDGTVNFSMGFKAAIKDPIRGGIYKPMTNVPTEKQFISYITEIADRNSSAKTELDHFVGRGMLEVLQSYNSNMIQQTGKNNTVGGEKVEGLDSTQYNIAGIKNNFIMLPLLNDKDRFGAPSGIAGTTGSRMRYTMFTIDRTDFVSLDGQILPAAEKVYFGEREMEYGMVNGVVGNVFTPKNMASEGTFLSAANGKDGTTLGIYSDCAYDFMARNSGLMELAY